MTTFPALPNAVNCLTPAIDVLVDNPANTIPGYGRGERLIHINYGEGNWSDVLTGWQAQATLNLRRVANEMMQARLPLATGQGLRELAASKYFVNVIDTPTKAIGQAVLVATAGVIGGGIIPAGTRLRRTANPQAQPIAIQAAEYLTTQDIILPFNIFPGQTVTVPIECTATGVAGNIVQETGQASGSDLTLVDQIAPPFKFAVQSATCSGGGSAFSDIEVRAIAGAQPQGRRGPTEGALYAGSYLALGVRHVAIFEDLINANTLLFVADESWSADTAYWQPAVTQTLLDNSWAGFGCSLNPSGSGAVTNTYLNVACTVQMRSQKLLQNTQAVQQAIIAKLNDYFNLRPDWYMFRKQAIRGAIAQADPRILTCTSVSITDRFGNTINDPDVPGANGTAISSLIHYNLLSLQPTFSAPI